MSISSAEKLAVYIPKDYPEFVYKTFKRPFIEPGNSIGPLMHGILGIASEAGELLDNIKKSWIYGKNTEVGNIREELGDVLYYVQACCNTLGCTIEELIEENMFKLRKRYPDGVYSDAAALERKDKIADVEVKA